MIREIRLVIVFHNEDVMSTRDKRLQFGERTMGSIVCHKISGLLEYISEITDLNWIKLTII